MINKKAVKVHVSGFSHSNGLKNIVTFHHDCFYPVTMVQRICRMYFYVKTVLSLSRSCLNELIRRNILIG